MPQASFITAGASSPSWTASGAVHIRATVEVMESAAVEKESTMTTKKIGTVIFASGRKFRKANIAASTPLSLSILAIPSFWTISMCIAVPPKKENQTMPNTDGSMRFIIVNSRTVRP